MERRRSGRGGAVGVGISAFHSSARCWLAAGRAVRESTAFGVNTEWSSDRGLIFRYWA